MNSHDPKQKGSHGSPERKPAVLVRAMADSALTEGRFRSRAALARELSERLNSEGVVYHVRTVKRMLSGSIQTVPPEVEDVLSKLLFNGTGRLCLGELSGSAQLVEPDAEELLPAYVLSERVLPLVHLWLHLHPGASKRALAVRLQGDLADGGISYAVDSLQAILAGKNRLLVRAEIRTRIAEYLREAGITSSDEAGQRVLSQEAAIQASLAGREFVPVRRSRELCVMWLKLRPKATARQLSTLLRQKLLERGVPMNLDYIQRVVSGKVKSVRRRLATALEEILSRELPNTDLDVAVVAYATPLKVWERDMEWVEADRISKLAQGWLDQHPGKSRRQLARRLARVIQRMGHSMSHNSIQPILGGWKRRTRRFVLRAVMTECAAGEERCLIRGCVFPAVKEGLCRACLLKKYGARPFQRTNPDPGNRYLRPKNLD